MKKLFTLLTLLMALVTSAWADTKPAIEGITLPDAPSGTLDLSSQTDFTANAYGWIVFCPKAVPTHGKVYWSDNATNGTNVTWTKPDGATAPFAGSGGSAISIYALQTARVHCIKFTGAEKASFLMKSGGTGRKACVSLYTYSSGTFSLVETKEDNSNNAVEMLYSDLNTSTVYVAYMYGNATSNSNLLEVALKAPVNTFTVTYKAGEGTGDDVVDNNAAAIADCPNTFTAPSGKGFTGWNTESNGSGTAYAVGATVTSNLTLYAQWAASHTVTYSLGSGTGTVPTQANVAEGATFTVAAIPGDLVPPTNQEFKCWNDGTNDYNPGATYTVSTSDVTLTAIYQDRTYKGLTPAETMDFDNPGTMFTSVWTTANNLTQNFYFDAPNGVAVFSAYALYQAMNNVWMKTDSGNSTGDTWDATGNFKGNSYYFSSDSKAATVRATERMHYYRVKGITSALALMGGKAKMEAYLVTAGVVSADPVSENSIDAAGILSITDLDASNEYIIKVYGNNGNSNVTFREISFTFTPVTAASVTFAAGKEYITFASSYALDCTTANLPAGLKAYKATGASASSVAIEEVDATVAAGTGLLLQRTGDTSAAGNFDIPVVASGTNISATNKLVGVTAAAGAAIGGEGVYDYVLKNGAFHHASSGTIAQGKAYLHLDAAPSAPVLSIDFGTTNISTTNFTNDTNNSGEYYNLNGQRVAQPTKGLYIVNGKKVVIK